jgi:hypothetical protein
VSERLREWIVAAIVAIGIVGGVALDVFVPPPRASTRPSGDPRFLDRSEFCPPPLAATGYRQALILSPGDRRAAVGLEPRRPRPTPVPANRISVVSSDGSTGEIVVGYGAPAHAGAALGSSDARRGGAGAAVCTDETSRQWFIPGGTSAIGYDQRILLHNPFPDEAVVRVSLLTPAGQALNQAGLDDVAVPAGEYEEVTLNKFVTPRDHFGAVVSAIRGRVVAWTGLIGAARGAPHGFEFTVGAPRAALRWFFPHGVAPGDGEETIALLNPNKREVTVTLSLAGRRNAAQPRALIDLPVPPRASQTVSLTEAAPRSLTGEDGGVSVTVVSTNGLPLVAERRVATAGGDEGLSSELGATEAAQLWFLPPPALDGRDDSVSVLNPGREDARASVRLLFADKPPLAPQAIQEVEIGAGLRWRIVLDRWLSGEPAGVLVSSDVPVVAERSAYSRSAGDIADVMGTPLKRSEG